jgi:hypothetical protein
MCAMGLHAALQLFLDQAHLCIKRRRLVIQE